MKTVKFLTLGCKANQYDTQEIRERFLEAGYREVSANRKADIYVINTCTVTHKADRESLYCIRRSCRENPHARIIVTGCLAELEADRVNNEAGVAAVFSNKEKPCISESVVGRRAFLGKGISSFQGHTRAFVKIQDGCDNFCSYCRVPLARGESRSRQEKEIIEEAARLVAHGFKEIVLTGICLGAYGKDLRPRRSLSVLIRGLEKIPALVRIRLSSIEAGDVSDALIRTLAKSRKLCRHLHIPIQSGDNKILKKMRRRYTWQKYLALIQKVRKQVRRLGITTDVLVGFPGETEQQFENTITLVKKIEPLRVHIFPFSPRPQTLACRMTGRPETAIVRDRIRRLSAIAKQCSEINRKKSLNRQKEMLIEGRLPGKKGYWEGYTDTYMKVVIRSEKNLQNQIVRVRLRSLKGDYTLGEKI